MAIDGNPDGTSTVEQLGETRSEDDELEMDMQPDAAMTTAVVVGRRPAACLPVDAAA